MNTAEQKQRKLVINKSKTKTCIIIALTGKQTPFKDKTIKQTIPRIKHRINKAIKNNSQKTSNQRNKREET